MKQNGLPERLPPERLQPSQFFISREKLDAVSAWFDAADLSGFAPLPVKYLDGAWVLTDGHTRACAAVLAGLREVPVCAETDALDWKAYRRCVAESRRRGVVSACDLTRRIVSAAEYARVWNGWCDALHAELAARRPPEVLVFETPAEGREADAEDYAAEFGRFHSHVNGSAGLDHFRGNYAGWLALVRALAAGGAAGDRLPGPTLFAVRPSDGRIVGMASVRWELDEEMLRTGGHVGYSVRPTERCRGYATEILRLSLGLLREHGLRRALVTCDTDNEGSAAVIRACGGVFENEAREDDGTPVSRYWIAL